MGLHPLSQGILSLNSFHQDSIHGYDKIMVFGRWARLQLTLIICPYLGQGMYLNIFNCLFFKIHISKVLRQISKAKPNEIMYKYVLHMSKVMDRKLYLFKFTYLSRYTLGKYIDF